MFQKIKIWVEILSEILLLMYLVSHLVSSREFGSRDKLDDTVSCLVSRLVTFVSLPALVVSHIDNSRFPPSPFLSTWFPHPISA